jgi:hypothetical protein
MIRPLPTTNPNASCGGSWCSRYVVAASRLVPVPADAPLAVAEPLPEWLKRSKPLTPTDDPRTPAEVASERHPGLSRLAHGLQTLLDETPRQGDGLRNSRRSVVKALFPHEAERITAILEGPARKPRQSSPDGLKTAAQAAAKLNCSIKTLNGHVASGALKYVAIGHGTKRRRKMFTDPDLNEFIANQTQKDSPCPSDATRGRRSGSTTSKSEIVAFSEVQRRRRSAKPRR